MKKLCFVIIFLLGLGFASEAQMRSNSTPEKEAVAIGLKGGLNLPRMLYFRNEPLGRLPQAWTFTPTGGLFVEIPVSNLLIIAPEAMYVQRGTDITYEHFSGTNVHYSMNVSYADVRLPFEFRWPVKPYFQPYLVAGAEGGMRLFGQIHIDRTAPIAMDQTIDVGDANMGLIHAGVLAGLGIRSRFDLGRMGMVVKLSATYHQGVLDTYSEKEKAGMVEAVNVNAYQVTGWRLPSGIEVCLGIAIPLESHSDDACASFSSDRRWFKHSKRTKYGY